MSEVYIDYDAKVQNALRSVVRTVLEDTVRDGLQGDHHFYIAFKTQAPGVNIPAHLISRFPDEMTIVLQHKFWGLKIHEDYFEIGLSFNQQPELLEIPFSAVVGFVDPSVQFALQFHDSETDADISMETIEDDEEETLATSPQNNMEVAEISSNEDGDNVVTLDAFRKTPKA